MKTDKPNSRSRKRGALRCMLGVLLAWLVAGACVSMQGPGDGPLHRWWAGLGPVIPHDGFPGDCSLCHVGDKWNVLVEDFSFDHERKTGVPLRGAHKEALCLRCHNDRGPVQTFAAKGCVGCHQDIHQGTLGSDCRKCHNESTWHPTGMRELHARTRLPLLGAHASAACHQCHVGARVGRFQPTDAECLTCHRADLARTQNPPHLGLGWIDRCDRCHVPTRWDQATIR